MRNPLEMLLFSEYNGHMTETGSAEPSHNKLAILTPVEKGAAIEFAHRIRQRMGDKVLDIRIFGSRARGEARADSDLDIWVLLDEANLKDRNEISDIGTDLFLEMILPFQIAPRVMSKEHYEQLAALERLFPREIERDGIII